MARTQAGETRGTAFLVSRTHVLTCAHCLGQKGVRDDDLLREQGGKLTFRCDTVRRLVEHPWMRTSSHAPGFRGASRHCGSVPVQTAAAEDTILSLEAQPMMVPGGEDVPPLPRVRALTGHSDDVCREPRGWTRLLGPPAPHRPARRFRCRPDPRLVPARRRSHRLEDLFQRAGLPLPDELARADFDSPPLLLIDEADHLIAEDRKRDYRLCRHLRALSAEGRCRFILAGFWELHRAAYLEYQSPILNLFDPIPLGPLDEKAARALAQQPLVPLGIRFASKTLVDELLRRSDRRPNLIARACDAALRVLPPLAERVITAELLHAVLDVTVETGQQVAQAFKDLGALTKDLRACAADRLVMYATVESDPLTLTEVHARLRAAGVSIPVQEVRESLERLTLAYVLKLQARRYLYPVPLVRDWLLAQTDGDPRAMLAIEAGDWEEGPTG